MGSIVSVKNLTVCYDDYKAINGANLEIFADDFICIIGPNGGGKTTLIKAILDTIPYSGEITLSSTLFYYLPPGADISCARLRFGADCNRE